MAIVFSNNVIEIAVIQTHSGRPVVNVWQMYHDAELAGGDKESVVEDFRDNWQDHVMAFQCDNLSIVSFDWRSLDAGDGSVGSVQPNSGKRLAGAKNENSAPPNVAIIGRKNTSNRPRGRKDGRCYFAGVSEGAVAESGALESAAVTEINGYLDQFYDGISDTSLNWSGDSYPVVLETTPASRAPGSASVTISSRRVTSLTVDPLSGTQRERLR